VFNSDDKGKDIEVVQIGSRSKVKFQERLCDVQLEAVLHANDKASHEGSRLTITDVEDGDGENRVFLSDGSRFQNPEKLYVPELVAALTHSKFAFVTALHVGDCSIGVCGAQALATMLRANQTLTELRAARNRIQAVGARAIASACRARPQGPLSVLDVRYNGISGVWKACDAVEAGFKYFCATPEGERSLLEPTPAAVKVSDRWLPLNNSN
jgi:hypothetical protein